MLVSGSLRIPARFSDSQTPRLLDSQNPRCYKHACTQTDWTLKLSDCQFLTLSGCQVLRPSDSQTLRLPVSQALRFSDSQTLRLPVSQALRFSDYQILSDSRSLLDSPIIARLANFQITCFSEPPRTRLSLSLSDSQTPRLRHFRSMHTYTIGLDSQTLWLSGSQSLRFFKSQAVRSSPDSDSQNPRLYKHACTQSDWTLKLSDCLLLRISDSQILRLSDSDTFEACLRRQSDWTRRLSGSQVLSLSDSSSVRLSDPLQTLGLSESKIL